jgi:hypothetical protein
MNRVVLTAALVVVVTGLSPRNSEAFPLKAGVHAYERTAQHVDRAAVDVLIFLETKVPPEDWCFWRFFHWLPIDKDDLDDDIGKFKSYVQLLNGTQPGPVQPIPIDKDGRVWGVDRREAGWSAAAVSAVFRLDKACREPHVDPLLADELRRAIGVKPDGTKYPHCEALVPGYWFVREVEETNRHKLDPENIAYYNLLYSRERFGDDFPNGEDLFTKDRPKKETPGFKIYNARTTVETSVYDVGMNLLKRLGRGSGFQVTNPSNGGYVYGRSGGRGNFKDSVEGYVKESDLERIADDKSDKSDDVKGNGFIDRDFPKDANDFQTRWGGKASLDFLNGQKVFLRYGTIIAGAFNDPKAGSIVSDNDRVNRFLQTPFGMAMDTNDFLQTSGRANLVNNPLGVALDDLDEDASEKIYPKQDKWPVFWLNGAKRAGSKRVEFGDPDIVHDKINGGKVTVQTLHKCIGCHYPSDVVLSPSNEKWSFGVKKGIEAFAKHDKFKAQIINRFFFDGDAVGEGWKRQFKYWREPYAYSLSLATRSIAKPEGWTGARLASVTNARRDWYDAPIRLGQAAAELGYSRLAVMVVCLLLQDDFDAQALFLDLEPGVPRAAWDADLFPKLSYLLALARDLEIGYSLMPEFNYLFPEYARESREAPYRLKSSPKK